MEIFKDPAFIEAKLNEIITWMQANILAFSTVLQFVVVALAFVIAWVAATKVRAWLERDWKFPWYEQYFRIVARALAPLSMPVIWLALQWFSVFAADNAGWPHHLITVVVSLLTAWVIIRLGTALIRSPQWSRAVAVAAVQAVRVGLVADAVLVVPGRGAEVEVAVPVEDQYRWLLPLEGVNPVLRVGCDGADHPQSLARRQLGPVLHQGVGVSAGA